MLPASPHPAPGERPTENARLENGEPNSGAAKVIGLDEKLSGRRYSLLVEESLDLDSRPIHTLITESEI